MQKVAVIRNGCPLCKGDVVGNEKILFLCKQCYVKFKLKHILKKEALFEDYSFGR